MVCPWEVRHVVRGRNTGRNGNSRNGSGEYRFGDQRRQWDRGCSRPRGRLRLALDEVSAAVAALFGAHARGYQALSAQAAAFHRQFVQALNANACVYPLATEAANTAATANPWQVLQQDLLKVINAPTEALLDRPLIGNGTNGGAGDR